MNKRGSIIIIVMLVLSLIATVTMQLVRRTTVHTHFDKVVRNREKAKMLALGGLNLAIAQLTTKPQEESRVERGKEKGEQPVVKERRAFLERVLPLLNTWQTFALDATEDGLAGELKLCLMSEDGKININKIFDYKKGEFRKEYVPWLASLQIGEDNMRGEFAKNLAKFLADRGRPLDDISQLLNFDDLQTLPLYYEPPKPLKQGQEPNGALALSDLFTIHSNRRTVEPWLLSNGMCALFGLRQRSAGDATRRGDAFKKAAQGYKPGMGRNWQENFSILQHIYEKQPQALPRLQELFSKEFDSTVFTVLSSGSVQAVEARLLAVLVKHTIRPQKEQGEATKPTTQQRPTTTYRVAKLYWL